jgi:hypothetical protein
MSDQSSQRSPQMALLRPICWYNGHEYQQQTFFKTCRRCGGSPVDYLWVAFLAAPIIYVYVKLKYWVTGGLPEVGDDE